MKTPLFSFFSSALAFTHYTRYVQATESHILFYELEPDVFGLFLQKANGCRIFWCSLWGDGADSMLFQLTVAWWNLAYS
jgi:hypothetical protein